MEEQALLLKENLLSLRSVLVTNRKKIDKVRFKRIIAEKENDRRKKIRMKEKIMETPKNIGKSFKGLKQSDRKNAKKSGLGNALGLLAIIAIGTNIESIKKLYTDFIKGETFRKIAEGFQNFIDFFKNLFKGFQMTTDLLGASYDQFVEFKDARLEELDELKEYFKKLADGFARLKEQAIEIKEKFENLLGARRGNVDIETEKENLEQYGFDDEKFDLIMGEDGNYRIVPKGEEIKQENDTSSNLGLTNFDDVKLTTNPFDMDESVIPFDYKGLDVPKFDYSQYNADKTNKEIVFIEKTNTIIK